MLLLTILLSKLIVINTITQKEADIIAGTVNTTTESAVQDAIFKQYNRYNVIIAYLTSLSQTYPEKISLSRIGITYEGRTIYAIKISTNPKQIEQRKPIILIDAGMHAREWMSPAVSLYLIYQLVQKKANEYLFLEVDWLIIPVLNPDGYEFTHTHIKTWRKTISNTDLPYCSGVDMNRNFDFHWMEYGSSKNECAQSYAGPSPFSEPETRAFRDFVLKHRYHIKLYINLHAYATMIVYPWSFTHYPINNVAEHQFLATLVAETIEKFNGTHYEVGQTSNLLYIVSGSSCDWMAGAIGVPLVYGIELPKGRGRFQPPTSDIVPTGAETFEGFKVFHKYVKNKWVPFSTMTLGNL